MTANALTSLRLALAVPVAWGIAGPGLPAGALLACVVLAIVSDHLDGYVARRTGTASARGQLFDHATDFLFVSSGLTAAAVAGFVPAALPVLIVVAFSQYVADSYLLHRRKQLRMSVIGRWNGLLYFVPLVILGAWAWMPDALPWGALVRWLSWGLVASTVVSIVDRGLAPRHEAGATFAGAHGAVAETNREAGE